MRVIEILYEKLLARKLKGLLGFELNKKYQFLLYENVNK